MTTGTEDDSGGGDATDRRAFEEVLGAHMDGLWAMALRLAEGREAEAEDLLQEAALKAFRGFADLEDEGSARSWLFTILTRTHLNRRRSRDRRPETPRSELDPGELESALAAWRPVRTPREDHRRHRLRKRLEAALDDLPPGQRAAVWLVDVEGFRQREAAEMLEVAEGTVASRLYRARRELRRALIDEAPGRLGGGRA